MRSTGSVRSRMRATADLTAAARIRDAAVVRFARDGLGASLKTIAADAGVSSGLILHHFGTKQGLRRACDEWVLAQIREAKHAVLATGDTRPWLTQPGQVDRYAPLALYVARSVQAGGPGATEFFEHLVDDAAGYLAEGVRTGVIAPSTDPDARARFLTGMSVGSLLLEMALHPDLLRDGDFTGFLRRVSETVTPPALELYTQGLLTNRQMLDDYLMYVTDPPAGTGGGEHAPAHP